MGIRELLGAKKASRGGGWMKEGESLYQKNRGENSHFREYCQGARKEARVTGRNRVVFKARSSGQKAEPLGTEQAE